MTNVVRAAGLHGYADVVRAHGADPGRLLRRHGLRIRDLDQPDALISLDAVASLMEDAAAATGCPDFGLRLANHQEPEMLGALAVVLLNSSTARQAVTDIGRYLFLHSPAYELVFDERSPMFTGCASVRFEVHLTPGRPLRQLVDGCLGDTWRWMRIIAPSFRLRGVSLPHTPAAPPEAYRRFFGAPVYFDQPYTGLHVPAELIDSDLSPANPMLRRAALTFISARVRPRGRTVAERVAHTLVATMGANHGTKTEVASLLGLHPRTLQRRLDDEGTTFAAVHDDVFRRATLRFLRETDLPLAQVAGALGYSEQSALTRACRRWFGATPTEVRSGADRSPTQRRSTGGAGESRSEPAGAPVIASPRVLSP